MHGSCTYVRTHKGFLAFTYVCIPAAGPNGVANPTKVNITFSLDEDLDARFRKAVGSRIGAGKGSIGQALAQAIELWLKNAK